MYRIISFILVIAMTFSLAISAHAQGYTVNQNWLQGNGNQVANVSQPGAPSSAKNNLHIYDTPPNQGPPQPAVVNQTQIHGHNNTVVNHNQNLVRHAPVFTPNPEPAKQLVNLHAMQYPDTPASIPVSPIGCHGHVSHYPPMAGDPTVIQNAVQNALASSMGGFGQPPVINVNININTIIGDNNKIINQRLR